MPTDLPHRVLVVEDEPDYRAILVEWLRDSGYAVREAGNGREAMDMASEESFDVVVTDLRMPESNGLELLEWFKVMQPSAPVIFLSGQATIHDAIMALREWGGFDFLEKPVDLTVLTSVIERAIAQRQLPAEVSQPEPLAAPPSRFAQRALQVIAERYREPVGLSQLSRDLGYSAAYLTDTLRRETGRTVLQWIMHHRLEEAKRLMGTTDWTGQQIAEAAGFSSYNQFLHQFRQLYGVPPKAWRDASKAR